MILQRKMNRFRDVFCAARRGSAQAALAGLVAACAFSAAAADPCPLAGERPMFVAELFFGLDIAGGGFVSDAAWSRFAASVIARQFPAGFTIEDANGNWSDPVSRRIVRERSKVLIVAAPRDGLAAKLDAIVAAYKSEFRQSSVGVVTSEACGKF